MGYMFRLLLSHLQALKEYLIFIESSATVYGRDIIHNYLLYMIPYFIL